jgi:hypothetical protein
VIVAYRTTQFDWQGALKTGINSGLSGATGVFVRD